LFTFVPFGGWKANILLFLPLRKTLEKAINVDFSLIFFAGSSSR
jgi:hypothetical protein